MSKSIEEKVEMPNYICVRLIAVCQIIERVDFNTIDLNFDNIKKFQETT
jgi:hypothetical protein